MMSYDYLLPPDWAEINLNPFEPGCIKPIVDRMFRGINDEIARVRISGWVTSQLTKTMTELAEQGLWAAYLPVVDPRTEPIRPMIVTRHFPMNQQDSDPLEVLVALAAEAEGEATAIEPRGMVGLMIRMPEDPKQALLDSLAALPADIAELADEQQLLQAAAETTRLVRRVQYVVGDPSDRARWLAVEASASCILNESAAEALDGVEAFFDAWVRTLSWAQPEPQQESSDE